MNVSPTLAMNNLMRHRQESGQKVYKLGFGQSPFPVPQILVDQLRKHAHIKDYLHTQGLPVLRESVSNYYHREFDVSSKADNVVIGPGSKELIFLSQLCLNRSLLLPRPSWVSYEPQARLLGLETHWIDTDSDMHWKLQAEDVERFLSNHASQKFVSIFNYPNNPTGAIYTKSELEELANVFRKYDVIVISDEIYGEFTFHHRHVSLASVYPEGTIVCSGLSKWCGAGGWRLGYMIFPKELAQIKIRVIEAGSETYSCASAPVQYAAVSAFDGNPEIRHYTDKCKSVLIHAHNIFADNLNSERIKMIPAGGGFYGLLEFNPVVFKYKESQSLCRDLLNETGVAVLYGSAFGMANSYLSARLAFVDYDGETLLNTSKLTDDHFNSLHQSVELLNQWKV